MKLTPKQQKFADYYIASGNATESYKKAGYKNFKSSGVEANKTLNSPNVKKYIEEKNKSIESERIADMKEVKEFWTNSMRSDQVELKDRLKASEYIAKTNGAFLDKVEHSGDIVTKINIVPAKKRDKDG